MENVMKEYITTIEQVKKFEENIKINYGFNSLGEFEDFIEKVIYIQERTKVVIEQFRILVKNKQVSREELEELGLEILWRG